MIILGKILFNYIHPPKKILWFREKCNFLIWVCSQLKEYISRVNSKNYLCIIAYYIRTLYKSIRTNNKTTPRQDHLNFYFYFKINGAKPLFNWNILKVCTAYHIFPIVLSVSSYILAEEHSVCICNSWEVTEISNTFISQVREFLKMHLKNTWNTKSGLQYLIRKHHLFKRGNKLLFSNSTDSWLLNNYSNKDFRQIALHLVFIPLINLFYCLCEASSGLVQIRHWDASLT